MDIAPCEGVSVGVGEARKVVAVRFRSAAPDLRRLIALHVRVTHHTRGERGAAHHAQAVLARSCSRAEVCGEAACRALCGGGGAGGVSLRSHLGRVRVSKDVT